MLYQLSQHQLPARLSPGMVVWTPAYGILRHKGIVSNRLYQGRPMIISCSARTGEVKEETPEEFSQGNQIYVEGYPGRLPVHQVLHRAYQCVGMRYDLLSWNSEHFVRFAHGVEPSSPQLAVVLVLATVGICLAAAARS